MERPPRPSPPPIREVREPGCALTIAAPAGAILWGLLYFAAKGVGA